MEDMNKGYPSNKDSIVNHLSGSEHLSVFLHKKFDIAVQGIFLIAPVIDNSYPFMSFDFHERRRFS